MHSDADKPFLYSLEDLRTLDGYYETMFRMHRDMHEAIVDDIASDGNSAVIEIACGTGWCVPLFRKAGLEYTGLDICETAIAACCLKYSDVRLINMAIGESSVIAPQTFDAVYSSSMLEHVGKYEEFIAAIWRLARRRMDFMFFEGLIDAEDHTVVFNTYDRSEDPTTWGGEYGMKVALQDHGPRDGRTGAEPVPGYFYNRYARGPMLQLLGELPGAAVADVRTFVHPEYGPRSWVTVRREGID